MIKIMFVCHGNICRSTMAEFVMKDMVQKRGIADRFVIDSSAATTEELGNPVYPGTRKKLAREGIYCGVHHAVLLTADDCREYDFLLGMDSNNLRRMAGICPKSEAHKMARLLDFSPRARDIADPWYTGNFDVTYDDIVEGCEALLAHLHGEGLI